MTATPSPSGVAIHPPYPNMVLQTIASSKEVQGIRREAIIKNIASTFKLSKWQCTRIVGRTLKRLRKSGHVFRNCRGRYLLTGKMGKKR